MATPTPAQQRAPVAGTSPPAPRVAPPGAALARALVLAASLTGALGLGGCAGFSFFGTGGPTFANTAEQNFQKGEDELRRKNFLDAIKYFQHVKTKFSFSKYAPLAELRIADADLGRERYNEAVDGYRAFVKAHPSHPQTTDGYAAFRVGYAYHKEIPVEWFLVPPAHEKDQGPVRDALRELSAFLADYPDSKYAEEARKLEEDCVRRLADHELYVAGFYLKKKRPAAAENRLAGLVRGDFLPKLPSESGPGAGRLGAVARDYLRKNLEARVLLDLCRTRLAIGKLDEASASCHDLVEHHADAPEAGKATALLAEIERKRPPAPPAPPVAEPAPPSPAPPAPPEEGGK